MIVAVEILLGLPKRVLGFIGVQILDVADLTGRSVGLLDDAALAQVRAVHGLLILRCSILRVTSTIGNDAIVSSAYAASSFRCSLLQGIDDTIETVRRFVAAESAENLVTQLLVASMFEFACLQQRPIDLLAKADAFLVKTTLSDEEARQSARNRFRATRPHAVPALAVRRRSGLT